AALRRRPVARLRRRAGRTVRRARAGGTAAGLSGHLTRRHAMRIHSSSFDHAGAIPAEFALGAPGGFGGNRNPQLAWDDVPPGTRSFALLCIDADAPTDPSLAGRDDVQIPAEHPRGKLISWAMADIRAGER